MKLVKLFGLFVLLAAFGGMIELRPATVADDALLELLYETYDSIVFPTIWDILMSRINTAWRFVDLLPKDISVDRCKQVLHAEQERLRKELDSLSYKNAIFSFTFFKDIKNMRDKKKFLSEQYDKCKRMLQWFEPPRTKKISF